MPKLNKKFEVFVKKLRKTSANLFQNNYVRGGALAILAIGVVIVLFNLLMWGRVYPNTYVAGINVGGKTPKEAQSLLTSEITPPEVINIESENQTFPLELKTLEAEYDFQKSAIRAANLYRTGNLFYDLKNRVSSLFRTTRIGLEVELDEEKLEENISVIAGQVTTEPVYPALTYQNGQISAEPGQKGVELKRDKLKAEISSAISYALSDPIKLETREVDPTLTDKELEEFKQRGESVLGKSLVIEFEDSTFTYEGGDILSFLAPDGYNEGVVQEVIDEIAETIERDPQNPVFVFENDRVQEFAAAKDGVSLKKDTLKEMVVGNLRTLEANEDKVATINAPVEKTAPDIQTHEVNDLGINELLGKGTSRFRGSISSRVHNIGVASKKFKGVIVPPGDIFSFNQKLGDVSSYTGYKQAYIIKDGKTVLGDGGGVCQVSTTLFRAVLDAGLPIVERRAHSYRVGYYEQDSPVGYDATIYSPITDLKFKNDTPGHLLIQTIYDPATASLAFEIYGTDDGRVATTTKPVVYDVVKPPEPKYVDDPSLPEGEIKQIEYEAVGSKVTYDYTVRKGGEVIYEKTFYSNYQPWQAIYLRGTGPAN